MGEMSPRPPEPIFSSRLFEGAADDYDCYRLPYADDLIEFVRTELALEGRGLLVDLGAGTGQVARALRPFVARAVALDSEPDMVEYGRARTKREKDGIEWHLGRAEDAEFLDGTVDILASGNAFHRFDRPVVVGKAARWLSSEGAIILLSSSSPWGGEESWCRELSGVIDEWLERSGAGARIPVGWERKEYPDEIVLREAGFGRQVERTVAVRHVWTIDELVGFLRATSFASRAALREHADAFEAHVCNALLAADPTGVYRQDVRFEARIARR
jgi:ubiquinone/menaquinone biosynthesis C-methylase UbiE